MNSDTTRRPAAARPQARRSRRILFMLGAVLVGLSPLILLELGLRLFDVARPGDLPDASAGFNRSRPLFERDGAVYRTTRAHAPFIAPQEFPVSKPRNGFRIFCFGGSTVYGHPFLGDTAFPKWLELELAGCAPDRSWQVINCGGISYASYRIVPLVQEALRYQPDLVVVATGHNEFLEDRTYHALKSRSAAWVRLERRLDALRTVGLARRWLGRDQGGDVSLQPTVHTRLDNASGYASYHRDDAWHERVVAQFDDSVGQIVADCRAAGVPLVLVKLGSNLRDCPPFKSEHRPGLPPGPEQDWQAAFDLARTVERSDPARALELYREAAAIDGEYALLNYRIARVLDWTGRREEALSHYQQAKDQDICPLRIITPVEQTLSRIAAATGTPLVDAAGELAAKSLDGVPGDDWYLDHVHPTIGGHQAIARALAAQMRASGLMAPAATWPEEKRVDTYARHLAALGPAYFTNGKRRITWLDNWAQRQRLAAEAAPVDAAGFMRRAFRQFELGDDEAAFDALREALKRDAGAGKLIRDRARQLVTEGRPDRAAELLRHLP